MPSNILVVDDSPSVRNMIANTLKAAGYAVDTAVDGEDALEVSRRRPVHAVITDQNMPRLDGLGFCRAFRARPENRGVPVVFLSTESEASVKEKARQAGAIGWMIKPFDQQKLLDVIGRVVRA
ncbi:response regulator [Roseivivax sediminis]|uniref:Two-component system, chemotaxis family, response regulator CheY n=1 Tax=Roseivivax sediminis TaxID=936889 RepID=A0A1I1UP20_9RHOB|nr:response regulator [Roseivivax sediminis]SFD72571.1 two-component system, chemotaxis family, response regulator CheY [Roseivivax sediminis]